MNEIAPQALFKSNSGHFPDVSVITHTLDTQETFTLNALLDSGATASFVDTEWCHQNQLSLTPLPVPQKVLNADGSANSHGKVTHQVQLRIAIQGHVCLKWFFVASLGKTKKMIIGADWLKEHNPRIDWITGKLTFNRCPKSCGAFNIDEPSLRSLHEQSITHMVNIPDDMVNTEDIRVFETTATRIAKEALKDKTVNTLEDIAKGPYKEFLDVFSEEGFNELPPHRPWDHAIELKPDWEEKKWKPRSYPIPPSQQEALKKEIDGLLASGRIQPSKSPIASPCFFVAKKDGKLRMVIDYRKLNGITVSNAYPLPLIPDLLDKWKGCTRFTKLDVRAGYHNIRIRDGDEWKTAFKTPNGFYEWKVMPFGLCNAPATFQNMMDDIFMVHVRRGDTDAYIDDVIIATKPRYPGDDDTIHEIAVKQVLQTFRENNLYLKPEKCVFSSLAVEYLGFVVSKDHVLMDPSKVKAILDWPTPKNLHDTRSFVGFLNYYRRFINEFSRLARPLHDLTKKGFQFVWGEKQQEAFDKLKEAVTSAPVLIMPDLNKSFFVEADASLTGYGAVLSQEVEGALHPVAFLSHSFTETERNYTTHDRELLAIVNALKEWRSYLISTPFPITVYSDHQALEYFKAAHDLNRRLIRYAVELDEFNLVIKHRPGTASGKPDALSRRPDFDSGKDDNKDKILLPEKFFINAIGSDELMELSDALALEQEKDPLLLDIKKRKEGDFVKGWSRDENQLWRYYGKIYVPPNYRRIVFQTVHSHVTSGHPGQSPTIEKLERYYYWPELKNDTKDWVKSCDECQRYKNFPSKKSGLLKPNLIPSRPWEIVTMDLLTDLPESEGYDAILVAVDRFAKMIRCIRTNKTMTSSALVRLCWDHIWKDFGCPRIIMSDRGPQFASKFVKAHNEILGIQTALSTAYHPQTDGQSERMIQEVQKTLRMYVNYFQNDWSSKLSMVEFAINDTTKSSTGHSPFQLVLGFNPNPGTIPYDISTKVPSVEEFLSGLQQAREQAQKSLEKAADSMKRFADRKRRPAPHYKVGDRVLLDASNYPTTRPSRKLSERRHGPFKIIEQVSDLNYRLQLPKNWKIHPVFHVDQLRPYHEDPNHPNRVEPPPDLVEGKEEYEVEEILDTKTRQLQGSKRKTIHFLVKWVGYHHKENTWEPYDNVKNSPDILQKFYLRNPKKPRPSQLKPKSVRIMDGGTIEVDPTDWRTLKNDTHVTTWPTK